MEGGKRMEGQMWWRRDLLGTTSSQECAAEYTSVNSRETVKATLTNLCSFLWTGWCLLAVCWFSHLISANTDIKTFTKCLSSSYKIVQCKINNNDILLHFTLGDIINFTLLESSSSELCLFLGELFPNCQQKVTVANWVLAMACSDFWVTISVTLCHIFLPYSSIKKLLQ